MANVRLGTFNVENLFARFRFKQDFSPVGDNGFTINDLAFDIYQETEKQITAKAIRDIKADVLCLQEVESLPTLERFVSQYLGGMKYGHRMVIDGNDPRFIDVAVLSRFPITAVRSHRHERNKAGTADLFSRDCLVVDLAVPSGANKTKPFRLYVNHFLSMMQGRDESKPRRQEQVERVAQIVDQDWKASGYKGNFAVVGDFNDYIDAKTSLNALIKHPQLTDVVRSSGIPAGDQWTHYWAGGNEYRQIDYLILPKPLYARLGSPQPTIMRKGLPWRAERYAGDRLDHVGHDNPKASDHCPVYIDFDPALLF